MASGWWSSSPTLPNAAKCSQLRVGRISAGSISICRGGQYKEEGSWRQGGRAVYGRWGGQVGRAHDFTTGRPITIVPSTPIMPPHQWSPHSSTLHSEMYKPIWTYADLYGPWTTSPHTHNIPHPPHCFKYPNSFLTHHVMSSWWETHILPEICYTLLLSHDFVINLEKTWTTFGRIWWDVAFTFSFRKERKEMRWGE